MTGDSINDKAVEPTLANGDLMDDEEKEPSMISSLLYHHHR